MPSRVAALPIDLTEQETFRQALAGSFFKDKTFIPSRLAEHLAMRWPTAVGGRELYAFRDGMYRPAERFLRGEIIRILSDHWRPRRGDDVISFLLQASPELWDRPLLDFVAVANGLLSLDTLELSGAGPDFLSPVRIGAAFDRSARCPEIDAFLSAVLDEDNVTLFHEIAGHLMVPEIRQRAFMFLGPGGNGKSVTLQLLTEFLGPENVSHLRLQQLDEERFASANLYGKLANTFADLEARALTGTSIFKSITGGDAIQAERKFRQPFNFTAYARLVFSANEPPPTPDSSDAFFDRWIIVPFERSFRNSRGERQFDELVAALSSPEELSGLLNHAIRGLQRLRRSGRFTTGESSTSASEQFRAQTDSIAGFLADAVTPNPDGKVRSGHMFNAYMNWCRFNNRRPFGQQRFQGRLKSTLQHRLLDGYVYYSGIELHDEL